MWHRPAKGKEVSSPRLATPKSFVRRQALKHLTLIQIQRTHTPASNLTPTLEARAGLFEATAAGEECRLVVPPRESFVRRGVPIRAEKHEVSTAAPSLRKPKIQPPSRTETLDAR